MKFFIDTANLDEIRDAARLGIVDGVTTNPTLIAKSGKDYRYAVRELARLSPGPVAVEVLQSSEAEICREAKELARIAEGEEFSRGLERFFDRPRAGRPGG